MSVEIRDIDDGAGVIITAQGILREQEWVDACVEHLTQDANKFKKYRYSISDYTAMTDTDISNKAVEMIATYSERASIVNPKPVVAIVADQDLPYGLARMWELLAYKTKWEKMVFRTRKEAEAWISRRVEEKFGIGDLTFG